MNDSTVLDIGQKALILTFTLCAPVLALGLVVGVMVSIFQAATQIHEMTLTFIPKMIAIMAALIVCGPWMLNQMVTFTSNLFSSIPTLIK